MPIYKIPTRIALAGLLLFSFFPLSQSACFAQTVKKNPDGTVEVMDDESSTVTPAPHSSAKAGSRSRVHAGSSGRIPGYTKRMGGVNVHRNADGTVEVTDMDVKTTWTGGSGGNAKRGGKAAKRSTPASSKSHSTTKHKK